MKKTARNRTLTAYRWTPATLKKLVDGKEDLFAAIAKAHNAVLGEVYDNGLIDGTTTK